MRLMTQGEYRSTLIRRNTDWKVAGLQSLLRLGVNSWPVRGSDDLTAGNPHVLVSAAA